MWDAASTKVVSDLPQTTAIATAGHSIAAMYGYPDGGMPLDLALEGVATIMAATDLPVTADLDDGYAEPGETIRRAIALGVVGANVEDRLKPLDESVARVAAIVAAAEAEGFRSSSMRAPTPSCAEPVRSRSGSPRRSCEARPTWPRVRPWSSSRA